MGYPTKDISADFPLVRTKRDYHPGENGYDALSDETPIVHKGAVGTVIERLDENVYMVDFFDDDLTWNVTLEMDISEMDFVNKEQSPSTS